MCWLPKGRVLHISHALTQCVSRATVSRATVQHRRRALCEALQQPCATLTLSSAPPARYYAINRHKATTLTPAYHAGAHQAPLLAGRLCSGSQQTTLAGWLCCSLETKNN